MLADGRNARNRGESATAGVPRAPEQGPPGGAQIANRSEVARCYGYYRLKSGRFLWPPRQTLSLPARMANRARTRFGVAIAHGVVNAMLMLGCQLSGADFRSFQASLSAQTSRSGYVA